MPSKPESMAKTKLASASTLVSEAEHALELFGDSSISLRLRGRDGTAVRTPWPSPARTPHMRYGRCLRHPVAVGGETIHGEIIVQRGDLPAFTEKLSDGAAVRVVGFLTNGGLGALASTLLRLGCQHAPAHRAAHPVALHAEPGHRRTKLEADRESETVGGDTVRLLPLEREIEAAPERAGAQGGEGLHKSVRSFNRTLDPSECLR